mmetsp:Transcript_6319/g.9729  ORF Transcript_6319/g.9729 Transcript_6319/m.9729 type:complete len:210 (-) Transcript_6319:45-674(-)
MRSVVGISLLLLIQPVVSLAFVLAPLQRWSLKGELLKACEAKDTSKILKLAEELKPLNPTTDIRDSFNRLEGDWKLDFTTAPAQEVPEEGNGVNTYQTIEEGIIYNIINRPDRKLKIAVGAEPTRVDRVALDFRTIEASQDSFPKHVTIRFPPRNFFRFVAKAQCFLSGEAYDETKFKELAYFDLLFLDDDLRIQRNSEGNLFINSRLK